ncbi:hypothetical protein [Limosilactobacillus reuteri]|uniref:hypothetical protein n=1 Tax=Limosilactobacillus reuteri TaxID=1598 RepID=UPI002AAA9B75|nr:hypothetical protein [Limosilactobacillus reuteri]WPU43546.1 hypothetical protein SH603_00170 [Limosilactobacillus reuteri]
MNTKTIEKEKLALLNMANTIKTVSETIAKNKKLITDNYWRNDEFALYGQASKLAIKIMLQELNIRATSKRVQLVHNELEEANYHCPVEAVLDIDEEITSFDYPIWIPEGTTLSEDYLDMVKEIINYAEKAA